MITIDGINYFAEKEISALYGLSVSFFRKARYAGKSPNYYKLKGKVFYTEENVNNWFKENLKLNGITRKNNGQKKL